MKVGNKKLYFIICLLLVSCSGSAPELGAGDYMHYMEDVEHPYNRRVTSGTQNYSIQLATPEYVVLKEFSDKRDELDTASFKQRLGEIKGHIYFLIKIEQRKPTQSVAQEMVDKSMAESMVMYYHSQAMSDIILKTDSVLRKPVTYLFENNYSLVNYNTIVVGFELPEGKEAIQLVFNDRYNDNTFIKAKYSANELAKLPRLVL